MQASSVCEGDEVCEDDEVCEGDEVCEASSICEGDDITQLLLNYFSVCEGDDVPSMRVMMSPNCCGAPMLCRLVPGGCTLESRQAPAHRERAQGPVHTHAHHLAGRLGPDPHRQSNLAWM